MILNRLELGTQCTVLETGEKGILKQIYFYPTKYELELPDGRISHYTTKQLEIDGIAQLEAKFKSPSIPKDGKGEAWSDWYPFKHESIVEHHFTTTKEIMWKMITSLEMYNIWFFGIQRALPVLKTDRYVHQYSFKHFDLAPGSYFKIRPSSLAPYFQCRIMTIEEEQEFGFSFSTNPFVVEYVHFSIRESENGVWVKCNRKSDGLFSFLSHLNWEKKSKIFQKLDTVIPKVYHQTNDENDSVTSNRDSNDSKGGGFDSLDIAAQVAYLVNKGLDGDMDSINAVDNKVVRGKAKAMIVKINRGSAERPPMPEMPAGETVTSSETTPSNSETDEELMDRLIAKGIQGDMDEINALENKVLRGKIKATIVKEKRKTK